MAAQTQLFEQATNPNHRLIIPCGGLDHLRHRRHGSRIHQRARCIISVLGKTAAIAHTLNDVQRIAADKSWTSFEDHLENVLLDRSMTTPVLCYLYSICVGQWLHITRPSAGHNLTLTLPYHLKHDRIDNFHAHVRAGHRAG